MTNATRKRLDRHLVAALCPPARHRARMLRRAMYGSWTRRELHAEYAKVHAAWLASGRPARSEFLRTLLVDLERELFAHGQ